MISPRAAAAVLAFGSAETLARLYSNAGVTAVQEVVLYRGRGYAAARGPLTLKLLERIHDGAACRSDRDSLSPAPRQPRVLVLQRRQPRQHDRVVEAAMERRKLEGYF